MENLLGFSLGSIGTKTASKHEELYRAHEQYVGKPPSELEKFLYGWLSVAQIEAKLEEFAKLEQLHSATH